MGDTQERPGMVRVINLADGPRDYPLKNGASIYLEPKSKHASPVYIAVNEISEALLRAERKGFIRINRSESAKEVKNNG